MKTEIRYVPRRVKGDYHRDHERVFRGLMSDRIRGQRIVELDIAAVQITSDRQIDELLRFLHIVRDCFSPDHENALEAPFDGYSEDSTKELNPRILKLKE